MLVMIAVREQSQSIRLERHTKAPEGIRPCINGENTCS